MTENAFAYNRGAHMGVSQSIANGYMGRCEMVWTTAGTNRVCSRCLALKDTVVGHTDESGVTLPPLHPRCRCAIMYREVGEPRINQLKPNISPLAAPPTIGESSSSSNMFTAIPRGVGLCKTFDEVKFYWAENYNVKVANEIGALHFESVRAAMSGVEAVLEEFPQAGFCLKEFDLYSDYIMSTWRGHGIILFDDKYFTNGHIVSETIARGVEKNLYPKNTTLIGAGAHEAGHIVEDWLISKSDSTQDVKLRIVPRKIIREAYTRAKQILQDESRTIGELKREISIYATSEKISECIAEAVSDYITNGENAALLSRTIWKILKEEL